MIVSFTLNGDEVAFDDLEEDMLLIDVLRDVVGLTGTKRGCESGVCGTCSVLVDDRLMRSCRTPVSEVAGRRVTTIEGMQQDETRLSDLQQAFLDHGAVQCGYCIPAMVLAGEALLRRTPNPSREEIRRGITPVLCRCTGYQQIVDAIEATAVARTAPNAQTASGGSHEG